MTRSLAPWCLLGGLAACDAQYVAGNLGQPGAGAPPGSQFHRTDWAVGSYPGALAIGDIDGNGTPDLVVANTRLGSATVLRGRGDGTFSFQGSYGPGGAPGSLLRGLTLSDLNADNFPDLVLADAAHAILYNQALQSGRGFQPAAAYSLAGAGASPTAMLAAQLNGDLVPDLAALLLDDSVQVLLGPGYDTPVSYGPGTRPQALALASVTASVAKDQRPDLLFTGLGAAGDEVWVLPARGDGSFGTGTHYPVGRLPVAVAAADLNGDGWRDLIVVNQDDDSVSVLLNLRGPPGFAPAARFSTGRTPVALAVADLDGDGHPDLAVVNQVDASLAVLTGKGDGTFGPPAGYPTGIVPIAVAAADLNCDGLIDLAVTSSNSDPTSSDIVSVFLNTGTPPHPSGCVK